MNLFKSPTWLEDSVKFVTYSSLLCGAVASGIAYLFGKEKGLLTLSLSGLFIFAVVIFRILSHSTRKWTEVIRVLEGLQSEIPNSEGRKSLARELRTTDRNILIRNPSASGSGGCAMAWIS